MLWFLQCKKERDAEDPSRLQDKVSTPVPKKTRRGVDHSLSADYACEMKGSFWFSPTATSVTWWQGEKPGIPWTVLDKRGSPGYKEVANGKTL